MVARAPNCFVMNMVDAGWEHPSGVWVDPRSAWFTIGIRRVGGMGQPEAVPFAERNAVEAFAGEFGGEVVDYPSLPRTHILGSS